MRIDDSAEGRVNAGRREGTRSPERSPTQFDRTEYVRWYDAFYGREYSGVVAFLRRCGAAHEDAAEAAQEAFVEVWRLCTRSREWDEIDNPAGWVRRVARNLWLRPPGPRRLPPTQPVAELPEPQFADDPAELTAESRDVLAALRLLDDEARTVLAYHLDGYSCVESADLLGITAQRARDALKKARRILKRHFAHRE